jgi:hypothetical protein
MDPHRRCLSCSCIGGHYTNCLEGRLEDKSTRVMYRIRNKKGLFYSSGRTSYGRWNKTGKWYTRPTAMGILKNESLRSEMRGVVLEKWSTIFMGDEQT